jgi:hypothetical protein
MVVGRDRLADIGAHGQHGFAWSLPEMPYSYHGRILSILWSVDLFGPARRFWRREELIASVNIVVSPTLRPFVGQRG